MTDLKDFNKTLDRAIKNAMFKMLSKSAMRKYSKVLAQEIKERTRLKKSVDKHGGKQKNFIKLADSTKKIRKRNKNILSSETSPLRSNLTMSGDMTDSISGKSPGRSKMEIYIKDPNRKSVARYHHDGIKSKAYGKVKRAFMFLSRSQLKAMEKSFSRLLKFWIDKSFK